MLTGRRAFDGDDISITLASVLKEGVDWQALPADLAPPVRRLLHSCLEKDPKRRLSSIGDARLEMNEAVVPAGEYRAGAVAPVSAPLAAAYLVPAWRRALPWTVAGTLGVALVSALLAWSPWRSTPAPTSRTLLAGIGADASLVIDRGAAAILSPDGTTLAFVAQQGGPARAGFDQTGLGNGCTASLAIWSWETYLPLSVGALRRVQVPDRSPTSDCRGF